MNNKREQEKLLKLISKYVYLERTLSYEKQAIMFYTFCTSLFGTEQALNDRPPKEQQLKQLYEVRKRFFKNYNPTNKKSDASDFHKYFYNKFIDEIRQVRLQKTGIAFSEKSVNYVNERIKKTTH